MSDYYTETDIQPTQNLYSNQDLLSQTPVPPQSPQYDRLIQEEKVANFISQTSPSKTLTEIDYNLKGFVFDHSKRSWVKIHQGIPDQIRLDFLQVMTPSLSENVRMGRLDMSQINGIMEYLIEWTVDYLDVVADDFNLTEEQMSKIATLMWSAVFYTLCRALNGVERDKMYNSLKLGDDFSNYAKQETKKSILDTILPWK
jgi:hypothetical protein